MTLSPIHLCLPPSHLSLQVAQVAQGGHQKGRQGGQVAQVVPLLGLRESQLEPPLEAPVGHQVVHQVVRQVGLHKGHQGGRGAQEALLLSRQLLCLEGQGGQAAQVDPKNPTVHQGGHMGDLLEALEVRLFPHEDLEVLHQEDPVVGTILVQEEDRPCGLEGLGGLDTRALVVGLHKHPEARLQEGRQQAGARPAGSSVWCNPSCADYSPSR